MKKYISFILVCAISLFCLTGCMESTKIIGTWATEDKNTTMTFNKDGSGSIKVGTSLSYTSDMTYTIEGTDLTITTTVSLLGFSSSTDSAYTVSFTDGNLVLTSYNEDGTVSTTLTLIKQ